MDTKLYARNQPGGLFSIVNREVFPIGDIWWVDSNTRLPPIRWGPAGARIFPSRPGSMPRRRLPLAIPSTSCRVTRRPLASRLPLRSAEPGRREVHRAWPANSKPTILIDGFADTYVSITGADTVLENICFKAGHADIAVAIAVGADGVEIRNCDFLQNVVNENFKICIDDGAANVSDRLLVEGCTFVSVDTANTHAISSEPPKTVASFATTSSPVASRT